MKKLSLDAEPPPKFRGEKEVNKKKEKTLSHILISIKNEKNENKVLITAKTIEKKSKVKSENYVLNLDYIKNEEPLEEKISSTSSTIEFSTTLERNTKNIQDFNYFNKKVDTTLSEKQSQIFYETFNSNYFSTTTQTFAKEEGKKENKNYESKEPEEKMTYPMYTFDEEAQKEEFLNLYKN